MSTPAYISDPQVQFLSQLLEEITDGHLLIPRFQRPMVWSDEQRLELMRSVAQSSPIGSILVWRTRLQVPSYERLGPYHLGRTEKGEISSYLLDGHQRLSTLFGALKASKSAAESPQHEVDDICWEIVYDLENQDFLLGDDSDQRIVNVPLKVILDSVESLRFQRTLFDHPQAEELVRRYDELATAFQRYKIPIIPIVTDDLDQATFTFQRVNSQGSEMSHVHMIHALTWSDHFDLNARLEEIRNDQFAEVGWEGIDDRLIIASCKMSLGLDVFDGDVDAVSIAFRENIEILDEVAGDLLRAIYFLDQSCNIKSPKLLPYGQLLPLLAGNLRQFPSVGPELEQDLRYWFWWTVYVGLAGGSNASRIRKAAENIRSIITNSWSREIIMPPTKELSPTPRRFDFRHARAKVLSLRMAEERCEVENSDKALEDLSLHGADMIQSILVKGTLHSYKLSVNEHLETLLRSPANRIVAHPEEAAAFRKEIFTGSISEEHEKIYMVNHGINSESLMLFGLSAPENLLEERMEELERLENTFAVKQGILRD